VYDDATWYDQSVTALRRQQVRTAPLHAGLQPSRDAVAATLAAIRNGTYDDPLDSGRYRHCQVWAPLSCWTQQAWQSCGLPNLNVALPPPPVSPPVLPPPPPTPPATSTTAHLSHQDTSILRRSRTARVPARHQSLAIAGVRPRVTKRATPATVVPPPAATLLPCPHLVPAVSPAAAGYTLPPVALDLYPALPSTYGASPPPATSSLRIATHNITGLTSLATVVALLRAWHAAALHVISVQETWVGRHNGPDSVAHADLWLLQAAEQLHIPPYMAYWAPNTLDPSQCNGVATFLQDHHAVTVLHHTPHASGRLQSLHLSWAGHTLSLLNTHYLAAAPLIGLPSCKLISCPPYSSSCQPAYWGTSTSQLMPLWIAAPSTPARPLQTKPRPMPWKR
jgi:hypothetical protein